MWPYMAVGIALGASAWTPPGRQLARLAPFGCLALLIVFIGLRYQLGYDWIGYERLFEFIPGDWSWNSYELSLNILPVELLFYYFNVFVKRVGGTFETLIFLIALINLVVIDRLCQKISPGSQPFVWFFYFCIAALAVQFNILRQALASSFVLMSLLSGVEGRKGRMALYFLMGMGFHVSILMLLPAFVGLRYRITPTLATLIVATLIAVFLSGAFLGGTLIGAVSGVLPSFLGSKADNYTDTFASGQLSGVSLLSMVLVLAYLAYLRVMLPRNRDVFSNIAIWLTVLVLGAHLAASQFPSVWNRIMAVSLPWQLATLWRSGLINKASPAGLPRIALGGAQIIALLVMAYQLGRPQSLPFVPYHSLLQVWIFGDEGDGRIRALYVIDQAQRQPE